MKTLAIPSLALGVCLLTLSVGVAFATNLHDPTTKGNGIGVSTTGQTGTQTSSLGVTTGKPTIAGCGSGPVGMGAKTNSGVGSPFNAMTGGMKVYAGAGAGNSSANAGANSQYDNACAQAQLH
jgi:hypothetical protein